MIARMCLVFAFVMATMTMVSAQQPKPARLSPPASAQCKLPGDNAMAVLYSSPRMKGRKIFGGLVPYGQIWRAGANEATTFMTGENLMAGGKTIPAGTYTIFTVPNPDSWTLIVNKHTGEWGIPYKYEAEELARIPMKVTTLPSPVEDFTISFDSTATGCTLHLRWERTDASVEFTVAK